MMAIMPKFADKFVDPEADPRTDPPSQTDELATIVGFLRWQRATLELKCAGLDAVDLAATSVESSTLSALDRFRHMADVERRWFRRIMAGQDAAPLFKTDADPDAAFNGSKPDPQLVAEAWQAWQAEVAFSDDFIASGAS